MKAPMKFLMALAMLGGVLAAQPVFAGRYDGYPFGVQERGYGSPRGGGQERRQYRETRSAQPPPQMPRERPRGQFTEEERRQFHRDLDKANRELYSGRRRRTVPAD